MAPIRTAPAQLLSVTDAARRLNVSRTTAYRLVRSGDIPAVRVGHSLRVDADELREYIYRPEDAA